MNFRDCTPVKILLASLPPANAEVLGLRTTSGDCICIARFLRDQREPSRGIHAFATVIFSILESSSNICRLPRVYLDDFGLLSMHVREKAPSLEGGTQPYLMLKSNHSSLGPV